MLVGLRRSGRRCGHHGKELLSVGDNLSSMCAFEKGRAKPYPLRRLCQRAASILIGCAIQWKLRYVESSRNPTDWHSRAADRGEIAAGQSRSFAVLWLAEAPRPPQGGGRSDRCQPVPRDGAPGPSLRTSSAKPTAGRATPSPRKRRRQRRDARARGEAPFVVISECPDGCVELVPATGVGPRVVHPRCVLARPSSWVGLEQKLQAGRVRGLCIELPSSKWSSRPGGRSESGHVLTPIEVSIRLLKAAISSGTPYGLVAPVFSPIWMADLEFGSRPKPVVWPMSWMVLKNAARLLSDGLVVLPSAPRASASAARRPDGPVALPGLWPTSMASRRGQDARDQEGAEG